MSRQRSNQARVEALRAKGWTNASIGRALGRDHSLIRQVGAGTKPGANLTQGLARLERRKSVPARGATVKPAPAPRRARSTGGPAAVRQSAPIFPSGVQVAEVRSRRTSTIARAIRRAADAGRKVSLTLTFETVVGYGGSGSWSQTGPAGPQPKGEHDRGEIRLAGRLAIDARDLQRRIDEHGGDDFAALTELASEVAGIESARGLITIELST
jgi:hypothetical protein